MPQLAIQSSSTPPPPPGYTLDSGTSDTPRPPSGYTLDLERPELATPLQGPNLGNMIQQDEASARMAGVPGGSPNVQPASETAKNVALGAIGTGAGVALGPAAGRVVLGGLKAAVKAAPYIAASEGINYARQNLPGGKYIPPGAELAPWFLGGGKGGKITGGAEAAEGKAAIKTSPGFSTPSVREPVPVPPLRAKDFALEHPVEPIPAPKLVDQIMERTTSAEPYPARPAQWPPEAPVSRIQYPKPSGYQALQEEQSLVDQIRSKVAGEDRIRFQRDELGTPKGVLNQQFNEAMGKAEPPVKYTKTPRVRSTAPSAKPVGTPATDDLTPILKKSLAQAMKKKGR